MALSGVWSPPVTGAAGQWLPGLSKGEEEKGEGVGWAQQDTLRGRRKLADRRELGSGAEAPGSGRAAMAEPGAAQTPETAEPCGGIPATELRPSHLTPSVLCTPPRSAAVRRAQEFGTQCVPGLADRCGRRGTRESGGTTFLDSSLSPVSCCFSLPPPPPPPRPTIFFFLHFATSCD